MKTNFKFTVTAAVAALALVAGAAQADILIETLAPGSTTFNGTTDNVVFNNCNNAIQGPGDHLQGCLNTDPNQLVDFLGHESLSIQGGGQAQIVSTDGNGFDFLHINLVPDTLAFTELVFNVRANTILPSDSITITAVNTLGAVTSQIFSLSTANSGQNFFGLLASNNQLISYVELSSTASLSDIEFNKVEQVRIGGITTPPTVPEPGTLSLLGLSLTGLAAIRRRRSA